METSQSSVASFEKTLESLSADIDHKINGGNMDGILPPDVPTLLMSRKDSQDPSQDPILPVFGEVSPALRNPSTQSHLSELHILRNNKNRSFEGRDSHFRTRWDSDTKGSSGLFRVDIKGSQGSSNQMKQEDEPLFSRRSHSESPRRREGKSTPDFDSIFLDRKKQETSVWPPATKMLKPRSIRHMERETMLPDMRIGRAPANQFSAAQQPLEFTSSNKAPTTNNNQCLPLLPPHAADKPYFGGDAVTWEMSAHLPDVQVKPSPDSFTAPQKPLGTPNATSRNNDIQSLPSLLPVVATETFFNGDVLNGPIAQVPATRTADRFTAPENMLRAPDATPSRKSDQSQPSLSSAAKPRLYGDAVPNNAPNTTQVPGSSGITDQNVHSGPANTPSTWGVQGVFPNNGLPCRVEKTDGRVTSLPLLQIAPTAKAPNAVNLGPYRFNAVLESGLPIPQVTTEDWQNKTKGKTSRRKAKVQCDQCGKWYAQMGNLNRHIMGIHERKKPFKCTQCPKSFNQMAHLNKHYRVHTGEKPYACEICHKSFSQKCSLNTHVKTHLYMTQPQQVPVPVLARYQ
eukprot:CAMPEP_0167779780 /NCGR_PEP_ID=MMETSP0111_2-20121227/4992_1 /TAXON_ID=91324 /ORGANISM="Lotharella globosa, Strain CCCM811" /LENGTH=569 /DNA_ID=CAMNT_0007670219 /DNA_START=63 /DNA_END=1772 /DNA_ORIENTATION=+